MLLTIGVFHFDAVERAKAVLQISLRRTGYFRCTNRCRFLPNRTRKDDPLVGMTMCLPLSHRCYEYQTRWNEYASYFVQRLLLLRTSACFKLKRQPKSTKLGGNKVKGKLCRVRRPCHQVLYRQIGLSFYSLT